MSAVLNSFALWGGLSILFSGWIVGYFLYVETRRHGSRRTTWRNSRYTPTPTIVHRSS